MTDNRPILLALGAFAPSALGAILVFLVPGEAALAACLGALGVVAAGGVFALARGLATDLGTARGEVASAGEALTAAQARAQATTQHALALSGGQLDFDVAADRGEAGAHLDRLQSQLLEVAQHARKVAERDLSGTLGGEGALEESIRAMVDQQRTLVTELSSASGELEAGTQQILAALRFQEQSAHEQAGAVEETRRTMDSLLEAAEQIARAAEQVHENAQRTRRSNEAIAAHANQLNQLTQKISDALVGINAIADRSDILALNAALEGTKAGEAGKGFILVAEEMRRLAENVVESVRQIQALVKTIREASQASVLATEEGVKLSEQTTLSADTIRLTSHQQQSGTRQVTQSMNAVSDLLAQTVAGARECTRATAELNRRAGDLKDVLSPFEVAADA